MCTTIIRDFRAFRGAAWFDPRIIFFLDICLLFVVLESVVESGGHYIGPPEAFIPSFRVLLCLRTVSFVLLNWFKLVYWPFGQSNMPRTLDFYQDQTSQEGIECTKAYCPYTYKLWFLHYRIIKMFLSRFCKTLQKLRKLQPHLMERRRMNDVGFCIDHIRTYQ